MAETLKTVTGSGTQSSTGTPQSAGQPGDTGARSNEVQPGTVSEGLQSQSSPTDTVGIPLKEGTLKGLILNDIPRANVATKPVPSNQVNPALFGISVILFIVAVALFWLTNRSAKSTTE
jgi:hypothetical protein